MTVTGAGDRTRTEEPEERRIPFERMPPGAKYDVWLADPSASHATFNLSNAGRPDLESLVAAAGLAFLDAELRDDAVARAWLDDAVLERASKGVPVVDSRSRGPGTPEQRRGP